MKNRALMFIVILLILCPATPSMGAARQASATYSTIQQAIDASQAGDVVIVAEGTYRENIVMKEGVSIEGGYAPDFSKRNISVYVTTIDGGKKGSVIYFTGITSASVDGFTITNGESDFGGGINCVNSSPTLSNNTIKGNHATKDGGGIRCYGSNPMIANNTITGNKANFGAGILCYESGPQILNNAISNNEAVTDGGGIECYNQSNAVISGNTITGNEAGNDGGGIMCFTSNPTLSNNTIAQNKAGDDGGGIECYDQANAIISGNTITGNKAVTDGGGIICFTSSPTISNNTIAGNIADDDGGGIECYDQADPVISNTIIASNKASNLGGGLYCFKSNPSLSNVILSGNQAFSYGGALYCSSSSLLMTNCTVLRNRALEDSAIYIYASSPQIANTIFWQNGTDLIFDFTSNPSVAYSDIADARFSGQSGNISADPLFVDINGGDYRLSSGSPCMDAGNPSSDQKDPDGSRNNMGAFGGPGAAAWGTDTPKIPVPYKEEAPWKDLGLFGGQINSLAIDPLDGNRMFAASWMGDGLFVTGNGGATWQTVEGFRNNDTYWVAIDPQASNRVWAAYNHFVAVSVNGGTSWSRWRLPSNRLAYSGAIDPAQSNTVYVGAGGAEGASEKGTVFKTVDGGKTWTQMGLESDKKVVFLAISRSNHQEVWAMTGQNEPGSVYKSSDGGNVWVKMDIGYTDQRVYKMVIHPESASTVFISGDFGVLRTFDGGKTWEDVGIPSSCNGIAMDPGNSNAIYASSGYSGCNNAFYKSVDGGATWNEYYIECLSFQCVVVDPFNSSTLYGGDYNLGVFKSADMGASWEGINQGIRASIIRDSAVDPNNQKTILTATQAGLFKKEEAGEWTQLSSETAYGVAFDPQDSKTIYAGQGWYLSRTTDGGITWEKTDISSSPDVHRVLSIAVDPRDRNRVFLGVYYSSGNRGEVYRSFDGGKTINLMKLFDRPVNVVKIDPADSRVIYAGTGMFYVSSYEQKGGLYKSIDGGINWTGPLLKDVVVNAIEIDPVNASVLYAGCGESGDEDHGLYKSVDGGLTWEKKDFDPCTITEVKINPISTNILYAATYRRGVYMSVDSGENWTNIGLSDYEMLDLSLSQTGTGPSSERGFGQSNSPRALYAGTNSGISAFTGSSVLGYIFNGAGTATIYPAKVWLDVGKGQYHAAVFDSGTFLIKFPPVGDNYTIYCTAEGYSQGQFSGLSVGAESDVQYDFHLTPAAVPDAPTVTVSTSGTTVTVSWTQVSGAAGYRLYYAPCPYTGPETIMSADMGGQTGISVGLWKGASFYLAATAYNSAGSSGYSNIAHFAIP